MEKYYLSLDLLLLVAVLAAGLLIKPSKNILELRYVYVAAMVLGLCGEALIALAGFDQLENRFIIPARAPQVYRYVAFCSLGFWFGYHATRWRYIPGRSVSSGRSPTIGIPSVRILVVLAGLLIVLEAVDYGLDIFLGADNLARGVLVQSGETGDVHYARTLGRVIILPIAVLSGVAWKQSGRAAYWAAPILLCIPLMAQFSRAMFLPLVAFLFGAALVTPGVRRIKYVPLIVLLVAASFVTGMMMRYYVPTTGLGRFAEVIMQDEQVEPLPKGRGFDTPLLSLVHATSTMPRLTLAFQIGPRAEGHKKLGYMLLQLPLPSFILPRGQMVPETSLTADLGLRRGNYRGSGFPYPLIAEMRVFLGWFGCILFLFLGWAVGKVDAMLNDRARLKIDPYFIAIVYGLLLNFIIRSFHSGLRPSLRPILYFAGAYVVWWLFRKPRVARAPPARSGAAADL